MTILRARMENRKKIVDALRAYWKANRELPFEARMMKQLTDVQASREEWRDAAYSLANPQLRQVILGSGSGNAVWSADLVQEAAKPSPAALKFGNPTAAEAMLAALDHDLGAQRAKPAAPDDGENPFATSLVKQSEDIERREIEDAYMLPIKQLRDRRIAPELARRCKLAETVRARCQLALVAHVCGDSEPLEQFCRDFEWGKLDLPRINEITSKLDFSTDRMLQQRIEDMFEVIMSLIESHLPEADKALDALADPKHPQNKLVVRMLLRHELADIITIMPSGGYISDTGLEEHPYFLTVLRRELDNTQPTGVVYRIKGDQIETSGGEVSLGPQPNDLGDRRLTRDQARQRICDLAAIVISENAWGMPITHPLYKDSESRLAAMKQVLDRYKGRFHVATDAEQRDALIGGNLLIPTWPPLSRPATAADIANGQAIFELGGHGKIAPLKLPAVGTLATGSAAQGVQQNVLILQAEIGADGKTLYGAVGDNILRAIPAEQLTDVKPLEPSPAQ